LRETNLLLWSHNPNRFDLAKREYSAEEPLPTLPTRRPRSFSVSTGSGQVGPSASSPSASACSRQPQCRFFTLPPEIRRAILIDAFGTRTLHMHLQPNHRGHVTKELSDIARAATLRQAAAASGADHPAAAPADQAQQELRDPYAIFSPGHAQLPLLSHSRKFLEAEHAGAWQWWGCVCHRQMTIIENEQPVIVGPTFFGDICLNGNALCVTHEAYYAPSDCFIGVMG
jgi:hypothetical protein